jgi:hypothetical protein
MDLFILDKLVIILIKKLMIDSTLQFSVLLGIGVFVEAVFPSKNKELKK